MPWTRRNARLLMRRRNGPIAAARSARSKRKSKRSKMSRKRRTVSSSSLPAGSTSSSKALSTNCAGASTLRKSKSAVWHVAGKTAEQAIEARRHALDLARHRVADAARCVADSELNVAALLASAEAARQKALSELATLSMVMRLLPQASPRRQAVESYPKALVRAERNRERAGRRTPSRMVRSAARRRQREDDELRDPFASMSRKESAVVVRPRR